MTSRSEGAPHTTEPKTFFITANDAVLLQSTWFLNAGNPARCAGLICVAPMGLFFI